MGSIGIGRPVIDTGIEAVEFIGTHAHDLRGNGHVDLPAGLDYPKVRFVVDGWQRNAVLRRIGHQSRQRHEPWHIGSRFHGQVGSDSPEIGCLAIGGRSAQRSRDAAPTGVVASHGE